MRVVYSSTHHLHSPSREVAFGVPIPMRETPERAEAIRRSLLADPSFAFAEPTDHGREPIEAVHDYGLVRFLEEAWRDWSSENREPEMIPDTFLHAALREGMGPAREPRSIRGRLGYWCFETMTPIVAGSYEAGRAAVDVALTTADLVLAGEPAVYGLTRPPGHHSARGAFGGYCLFNNAAVAAAYLASQTGEPVAIMDLDFHHGNGSQQIFYSRGDVRYVSLHGDPDRAYPYYSGRAEERGVEAGVGANLNLPLSAGCTEGRYLEALDIALGAIAGFGGSILVVSLGLDSYREDPLGDFSLTTGTYQEVGRRVSALGRKLVILQEGGYWLPGLGENVRAWLRGAARLPG